jgi:replicative DNA helicase
LDSLISIETEQAVLGALLLNNKVLEGMPALRREHFYDPLHAKIFSRCQEAIESGESASPVSLLAHFRGVEVTGDLSVARYLSMLMAEAVTTVNAPSYARQIMDLASRRKISDLGGQLTSSAANLDVSLSSLGADAIDAISEAMADGARRPQRAMTPDLAMETFMATGGQKKLPTGLASLDRAIGGWQPGMFTIMAGRPGMGKTVLASNAARTSAAAGTPALIFSMEMSYRAMWARLLADECWNNHSPIQFGKIIRGEIDEHAAYRIRQANESLKAMPLWVDDGRNLTVGQVAQRCRRRAEELAESGMSLGLVVVDHLGKINPGDRYKGQKQNEVAYISGALADLCVEIGDQYGAALVALSQLNRVVEAGGSEDSKIPDLHHLRDSGALEQDARIVGALHRPAYYAEKKYEKAPSDKADMEYEALVAVRNMFNIHMLKNDSGPLSVCKCSIDIGSSAIRNEGVCTTNYYEGWR